MTAAGPYADSTAEGEATAKRERELRQRQRQRRRLTGGDDARGRTDRRRRDEERRSNIRRRRSATRRRRRRLQEREAGREGTERREDVPMRRKHRRRLRVVMAAAGDGRLPTEPGGAADVLKAGPSLLQLVSRSTFDGDGRTEELLPYERIHHRHRCSSETRRWRDTN